MIEKEDDVRHVARRKRDRDNRRAAGDGPVRRDVEPLPPDHDAPEFAAVKMRHRIDVARVVDAALERDCALSVAFGRSVFVCHSGVVNWITVFAAESTNSSATYMAVVLADLLDEGQRHARSAGAHAVTTRCARSSATMRCDGRVEEPEKLSGRSARAGTKCTRLSWDAASRSRTRARTW